MTLTLAETIEAFQQNYELVSSAQLGTDIRGVLDKFAEMTDPQIAPMRLAAYFSYYYGNGHVPKKLKHDLQEIAVKKKTGNIQWDWDTAVYEYACNLCRNDLFS